MAVDKHAVTYRTMNPRWDYFLARPSPLNPAITPFPRPEEYRLYDFITQAFLWYMEYLTNGHKIW